MNSVTPYLPLIIAGIAFIVLLIAVIIFIMVLSARRKRAAQKKEQQPADEKTGLAAKTAKRASADLTRSFKDAMKFLRSQLSGWNYQYKLPWFLLIGEKDAGKSSIASNIGLPTAVPPLDDTTDSSICEWHFFDQGVLLDISGKAVLSDEGRTTDDASWQTLLRLLQRFRPQRPLDGIVLTIPCDELLEAGMLDQQTVSTRADFLYEKLMQAQRSLGLSLPVYIIISKCDAIPGFTQFCREIPQEVHDQMLGWSNPYSLEINYAPSWMDEAFSSIGQQLYQAQFDLLTSNPPAENSDDLFVFPLELEKTREPLRTMMNAIFKPNVYQESLIFRGLYFSGDRGERKAANLLLAPVPAPEPSAESEEKIVAVSVHGQPKPVFLKHLFEKKIFPEFKIARPSVRMFFSRNRTILALQVLTGLAIVTSCLGMWIGYANLQKKKDVLVPFLHSLAYDAQLDAVRDSSNRALLDENVVEAFLNYTNNPGSSRLLAVFYPSSWFSPLHEEITQAITVEYGHLILRVLYTGLQNKSKEILKSYSAVGSTPAGDWTHVELTREFLDLQNYVQSLRDLEKNISLYNDIRQPGEGDLSTLNPMLKYLFSTRLQTDFNQGAYYFRQAVIRSEGDEFKIEPLRADAEIKLNVLLDRFYNRIFNDNPFRVQADHIAKLTFNLINYSGPQQNVFRDSGVTRQLQTALVKMDNLLAAPELLWVAGDSLNLGVPYEKVLAQVASSSLLNENIGTKIRQSANAADSAFKARLRNEQTAYGAPILTVESGKIKLSPDALGLKSALETLHAQDFTVYDPTADPGGSGFRYQHFTWNIGSLEAIGKRVESFNSFLTKTVPGFPSGVQQSLKRLAIYGMESDARGRLIKAQQYNSLLANNTEESLNEEIQSFSDAMPMLGNLMSTFDAMEFPNLHWELAGVVRTHAGKLLTSLDDIFEQKKPYDFDEKKLGVWTGKGTLSPVLFNARQDGDMEEYVAVQQKLVRTTATNHAKPLVNFLSSPAARQRSQSYQQVTSKWQQIITDLEQYDNKVPTNALTALENFLLKDMDSTTLENFYKKISPRTTGKQSSDFFTQKLIDMRGNIYHRLQTLANIEASSGYLALMTYFNEHLAYRFPFSSSENVSGSQFDDADPEDIRYFFQMFDKYEKVGWQALRRNAKFDAARADVVRFMNQMADVRSFFGYFLDSSQITIPAYDVEVEFRANQRAEQAANQIVDWNLSLGDQNVNLRDLKHRARWKWNTPLRLSLRWAKNSPFLPVQNERQRYSFIEGQSAIYDIPERWSLLRFLKLYSAVPNGDEATAQNLLAFSIGTAPNGTSAGTPTGKTRVFIKLSLYAPDAKLPLAVPVFPATAPALNNIQ